MKNLIIRMYGLYMNVLAYLAPTKAAEKGFLLFCKPLRVPLNQKQKQFFNSAERFSIDHENEKIQGYRWGSGEKKILFLHGWQSHTPDVIIISAQLAHHDCALQRGNNNGCEAFNIDILFQLTEPDSVLQDCHHRIAKDIQNFQRFLSSE